MALTVLTPGTHFARDFKVEALLAEGGMGAVYRAEQLSTGNTVALKIMLPELVVDPKSRERFQQEARVSGRIKSNHVVKVLAAGIDEASQTPWIAMEIVDGESLASFATKRGALAPEVALVVLQHVGHALAAAHLVGVVHCDIKPENVLIAAPQSVGVPFDVKVLDFGIARIIKEGRQSVTVTSALGSPHWLAPEQGYKGKSVSPATDVWSFGLLAFYLLTGRYYWVTANVPDDEYNMYALLVEIDGEAPIAPASERLRALGEGRALLPPGFDGWFARCVDRDVKRRFQSAREAVDALPAALQYAAVAATRTSMPSVPQGVTRAMTVGVQGLAPPGYPAIGGAEVSHAPLRTVVDAPTPKRPVKVIVAATVVGAVLLVLPTVLIPRRPVSPASTPSVATPGMPGTPAMPAATRTLARVVPPAPRVSSCSEGMSLVPEGTFTMGSTDGESDERPAHRVHINAFCMDTTEVTVAAFRAYVNAGNRAAPVLISPNTFCNWGRNDRDSHPINCVAWAEADTYCRWSGHPGGARRLPTEAEWEYAARGTDGRPYPWGTAQPVDQLCWSGDGTFRTSTCAVRSFPSGNSPFGLFDMAGNVWEWTADWYGDYGAAPLALLSNPTGPATGTSRAVRVGGWGNIGPAIGRAAAREGLAPGERRHAVGFRCARGAI